MVVMLRVTATPVVTLADIIKQVMWLETIRQQYYETRLWWEEEEKLTNMILDFATNNPTKPF